MKTRNLDCIHTKLHKDILLAQSYSEIPELVFIIKSCRLKPYDYIFNYPPYYKITLYDKWFDEFGNTLNIIKRKNIQIIYNDLSVPKNKIVCTDLYHGLSLKKIVKMSKLIHLLAGKDEDLHQDCFLLNFLGLDDCLRCHMLLYGRWQQVSPLILGLSRLRKLSHHLSPARTELFKNKNLPLPCERMQEWISWLPVRGKFANIIKKYDKISYLFEAKE